MEDPLLGCGRAAVVGERGARPLRALDTCGMGFQRTIGRW